MRRKAVLYLRTATRRQHADGSSISAQEDACRRLADDLDLPVAEVYADVGASGRLSPAMRPGLESALEALCQSAVLIAADSDRLAVGDPTLALLLREVEQRGATAAAGLLAATAA